MKVSNERKRLFAMLIMITGVGFHITSISTDFWLQKASPVKGLLEMNLSTIFMWKSLNKVCLKMPPNYETKCGDLKMFGMENGKKKIYVIFLPIRYLD